MDLNRLNVAKRVFIKRGIRTKTVQEARRGGSVGASLLSGRRALTFLFVKEFCSYDASVLT
jgi:hypothetical protein